jgi:hypothetical protein
LQAGLSGGALSPDQADIRPNFGRSNAALGLESDLAETFRLGTAERAEFREMRWRQHSRNVEFDLAPAGRINNARKLAIGFLDISLLR